MGTIWSWIVDQIKKAVQTPRYFSLVLFGMEIGLNLIDWDPFDKDLKLGLVVAAGEFLLDIGITIKW